MTLLQNNLSKWFSYMYDFKLECPYLKHHSGVLTHFESQPTTAHQTNSLFVFSPGALELDQMLQQSTPAAPVLSPTSLYDCILW